MRIASLALLVVCMIGCYSTPPLGEAPSPQTVRVTGAGGGELRITPSSDPNVVLLASDIERVWRTLPLAYDSVGLNVDAVGMDRAQYRLGSGSMKIRRQLGGTSLTRFLDCGGTQIGPSAATYDITLAVTTTLELRPAGATAMLTTVEASGKPPNFSQGHSPCRSTGQLERLVADVVRAKLR